MKHIARAAWAVAISAVFVLGACGGGDDNGNGSTLEEYLREFDRITDDAESGIDRAIEDADEVPDDASVEEFRDALNGLYGEFDEVFTNFRDDLAGLDPPEEAADEHEAVTDAFAEFQEELDGLRDDIQSADSREDMIEISEQFGESGASQEASERADEACLELQRLADENDVDVDLECGEE